MLRTFIAVADKGSFAEAARSLNMTPSTATRAVKDLEDSLGLALLMRTTRSVRLTEIGESYIARCRAAIGELDAADNDVRGVGEVPRGTLVITAPVVFGRLHVVPIVDGLVAAYPDLNVRLLLLDRIVRVVEEGIDVAVRIADLSDSALHAARVGAVSKVLTASPRYLEEHGEPCSVADLHKHRLINFDGFSGPPGEWRFGMAGRPSIRLDARVTINNADAAILAACRGMGITRVNSYQVAAEIADGRLKRLLVEHEPPPAPVHLLFQGQRSSSPNIRAFIDAAKTYFKSANLG
ncbi:LysR family transcriptional regulator [Sphingomonas morindae]|uniref:LysR family transcriptional regulator n=1 Tax=Sphingomonas morindae TaxID=1541170 RepID=A0ABY4X9A6_9SPHN|nr:LysR family transcriptional regulator [Sphingomonas morindae]USI73513.1 LysR family transcriptional regulator [Sphingomonas morindae]